MRGCHGAKAMFDDPNLVSCAGLMPVLRLAEHADVQGPIGERVTLVRPAGVNAHLKVPTGRAGSAPDTFATKTAADRWLAAVETDLARAPGSTPSRAAALSSSTPNSGYAAVLI